MSEDTPSPFLIAITVIGGLLLVGALGWTVRACDTAQRATFDSVNQEIDTKTFERSSAYRQGLRRDFDELLLEYDRTKDPASRSTIVAAMRHRAEGSPPELVPPEVTKLIGSP